MKKQRLFGIARAVVILLFFATGTSNAQYRGPQDFHGIVKLAIPFPQVYPPINTGMPYNVMLGYIYYDSLVRYFNVHNNLRTDSLAMTIGPDTIRKALKYAYEMIDYDPIAWLQFQELFPRTSQHSSTPPSELFDVLIHRASQVIPDKAVSAGLTNVDAILQVTVTDTSSVVDTMERDPRMGTCEGVRASIDDVIKGQNLTGCNDTQYRAKQKGVSALSTPSCIALQYQLYWLSNIQETFGIWNSNRPPWMTPGNDYIVFLKYIALGQDTVSAYASLSPGGIYSTMCCMYPIRDGIVYDPNNDFGIGTNLSVADFKSRLRAKIQTITSY